MDDPAGSPPLAYVPIGRLLAHEEYVADRVEHLVRAIRRDGHVRRAVVADKASFVILDGHHRFEALKRIGCRQVPALLVDYADPAIRVGTWREGEDPPSKEEVLRHAREGKLYPPKTTRHFFPWKLHEEPVDLAILR